jgi:DNA polymerase-3 subunit gamma/tau
MCRRGPGCCARQRQLVMSVVVAPYQSLYRRYRPQRFSEVRGQDLVASTLRNEVRDGRIVHAYLFSGPRGTGKTSTARILAKALNCQALEEGEPCGRCESCVGITEGSSLDVHELDAASNNGVDAMRDLVSRASLATPGNRKVYIIDEVHMLSTAASNALLKTLEEPPEHVVFVLATTDPQKVLPTIKSRTQHFEFHLIEPPVLEGLLSDIAKDAGLELPSEGIEAAVRRGHGSARDALSVLDQVVASGVVEDDSRLLVGLVQSMAEQDPAGALRLVNDAFTSGYDAHRLAAELVETLREQFLTSVARPVVKPEPESLTPEGRALLPPARCVRALELIGKAVVDMREAIEPRTVLEVALVRLTNPDTDDSTAALLDRLERLERKFAQLSEGALPKAPQTPEPAAAPAPPGERGARPALGAYRSQASADAQTPARPAPAPVVPEAPADKKPFSRDELVTAWGDVILPSLKPRARAIYAVGRFLETRGNDAVFALPNAAHVEHATALREEVASALSRHFGARIGLELVTDDGTAPPAPQPEATEDELVLEPVDAGEAVGPHDSASWAESRLREVFPGAEEVTG